MHQFCIGSGKLVSRNFALVSDDYVCLEALKTDEENSSLAPRTPKVVQVHEEVYDDVEGIQREL